MRRLLPVVLLATSIAFTACATDGDDAGAPDDGSPAADKIAVTVGSADFGEARILGEIYAQALEAEGFDVSKKLGLGARDVYIEALEEGEIDIVPEYTGNLLRFVTEEQDSPPTSQETYDALEDALAERDLTALEPSDAEDKDGVVVTEETADRLDLEKVSDLADHARDLVFAGPPECRENPACLKGLQDVYGLDFKEFKSLAAGAPLVTALKEGEVDAANIFSTDGQIAANDFVVLDDDKGIAGAQNVVPLLRADVLESSDEIAEILNEVSSKLTTESLTEMNKRVDIDKDDPDDVAGSWLRDNGFIT